MKKFLLLLVFTMLLQSSSIYAFSDVSQEHWAYQYINELSNQGVINGYEDGTFRPDGTVSNAEFTKLLVTSFYSGDISTTGFKNWADPYFQLCKNYYHILKHDEIKEEDYGSPITRKRMAVMTAKADIQMGNIPMYDTLAFVDTNDEGISQNERDLISHSVNRKLIVGYEDGTFGPNHTMTRAEAATIIYRFKNLNSTINMNGNHETNNYEPELVDYEYSPDELYTEYNYYVLRVTDRSYSPLNSYYNDDYDYNNILKEVTYSRYLWNGNSWVEASSPNQNPLFKQSGKATILTRGSTQDSYYIPMYSLSNGKNKIIVSETTNGGNVKTKEYIINKISTKFDKEYEIKPISDAKEDLCIYSNFDIWNLNLNDYPEMALMGSYVSKNQVKTISWKRYIYDEFNYEWEDLGEYGSNNLLYRSTGTADYSEGYWAVALLATSEMTKVDVTIEDILGNTYTKTVYVSDIGAGIYSNNEIRDEDISGYFINNIAIVSFNDNVLESQCLKIIDELDGKVVGQLGLIKCFNVKLNHRFETEEEFEEFAEKTMKQYPEIEDMFQDMIMNISFD